MEKTLSADVYSEVYEILNMMGEYYKNKLPRDLYLLIEKEKNDDYIPNYNSFNDLNINSVKKESISMIALFHKNYWGSEYSNKLRNEILKNNEELWKNKYDSKNIFKPLEVKKDIEDTENVEMVVYKDSFIKKIFNKILNFFNKKNNIN